MLKRVFASDELGTNVTSGEYHKLKESITVVDVRNAVFAWPYAQDRMDDDDDDSEQCTDSTTETCIGF